MERNVRNKKRDETENMMWCKRKMCEDRAGWGGEIGVVEKKQKQINFSQQTR